MPVPNRSPLASLWRAGKPEVAPLIQLAVPLVAGLTSATLVGVTDTFFLGPLGEVPLAAASLTGSFLLIAYAALYGFLAPVGLLIGQAFGADDPARVASVIRHGRALALGFGLLSGLAMVVLLPLLELLGQPPDVLAAVPSYWTWMAALLVVFCVQLVYKQFYDAIDRPWTGLGLLLTGILLNIPLTWALVGGHFGLPAMGLAGAGLSSFIGYTVGTAALAAHYHLAPSTAAFRAPGPVSRSELRAFIREGTPMGLQYLFEGGSVTVAGVLLGLLGATALAANQIVFSVSGLLFMVPLGVAGAVGIRIAQAAGAQAADRIRAIGFTAVALVTLWTAFFTVLLMTGGHHIAGWFVEEADVIGVAGQVFFVVGLMQVCDGIQSVTVGALRGILDAGWPLRVSLIAYWLVALPLGAVLAFGFDLGAPGLWGGYVGGLALAAFLLARRFFRKSDLAALRASRLWT